MHVRHRHRDLSRAIVRDGQNENTLRAGEDEEKRGWEEGKVCSLENEISVQIPDVYASDLQRDAQHVRTRPPIRIKARVVRQVLQSYGNQVLSKS